MRVERDEGLEMQLRALKLPSFVMGYAAMAERAAGEGWTFVQYLRCLVETELSDREQRRVERLRKESGLPRDKTATTLDAQRLPVKVQRKLPTLYEGGFVRHADNLLAFGLPGRGKTHVTCAIGHELVTKGYRVLFTPAFALVQRLLAAKRELVLEKELRRLDRYEAVILDDIGYIQQDREEMEVLFTFLSERYERRSVLITSNLVFSQWDRIFKDPMTTACAIDRLVHHSIILELTGPSFRSEEAKKRNVEVGNQKDQEGEETHEDGASSSIVRAAAPSPPQGAAQGEPEDQGKNRERKNKQRKAGRISLRRRRK